MKEYDIIAVGSGSVMSIVSQALSKDPDLDVAVVEKDEVGGICLTRGCIPSKMILYPAKMVEHVQEASKFGIETEIKDIDIRKIMERMREHVDGESEQIRRNLERSKDLDFYHEKGEFIDDYTMEVGDEVIKGERILICSGSQPSIPPIDGLEKVSYITSRELLRLEQLPESVVVIGGGYIAAEYGYFLAMMGSDVTIVGRNTQFVPDEEPEVSDVLEKKLSRHMDIYTGHEVKKAAKRQDSKIVLAKSKDGEKIKVKGEELFIATGRMSNAEHLKPENTGVETDERGWIEVDEQLKTTKENIWAMGDAIGKYLFKHAANHEAEVVYYNAIEGQDRTVDHHAVPHAVFTHPQVASVGLKEKEAEKGYDNVLMGYERFDSTAKGSAMMVEDYFVKVLVDAETYRILGAHIVGPEASVLIQEIVDLMNTKNKTLMPIYNGMHIHPSLSEVVERAFFNLHSHSHDSHSHEHSHGHSHEDQ